MSSSVSFSCCNPLMVGLHFDCLDCDVIICCEITSQDSNPITFWTSSSYGAHSFGYLHCFQPLIWPLIMWSTWCMNHISKNLIHIHTKINDLDHQDVGASFKNPCSNNAYSAKTFSWFGYHVRSQTHNIKICILRSSYNILLHHLMHPIKLQYC